LGKYEKARELIDKADAQNEDWLMAIQVSDYSQIPKKTGL
jgi:hypothetical protein